MRSAEADALRDARRAMRDRDKAVRGAEAAAVRGAMRSIGQRKRMLGESIKAAEAAAIRQAKDEAHRKRKPGFSEPYSATYNSANVNEEVALLKSIAGGSDLSEKELHILAAMSIRHHETTRRWAIHIVSRLLLASLLTANHLNYFPLKPFS